MTDRVVLRAVYMVFIVWVLAWALFVVNGADPWMSSNTGAENAFGVISLLIIVVTSVSAGWQAVQWVRRTRIAQWILAAGLMVAIGFGMYFTDRDGTETTQATKISQFPVSTAERLEADAEPYWTGLWRNGDVVWVEWLSRSDHGGSYLRPVGLETIGSEGSSFHIGAGTKFVFKAPDQPARVFMADRALSVPKSRDSLAAITETVVRGSRSLSEPVVPWNGDVYLHYTTRTEIKKNWTDGELVGVDWASGGRAGTSGQAYLRIVSGQMLSSFDGNFLLGSRFKITAGTVFDIKVPNLGVQRHTAMQNFYIAKTGYPPIGDIQVFVN